MFKYSLRQLEYAVACADLGSVAAAAVRLGVAQPTVSTAVQKLEEHIGLQIFVRHTAKGVTPSAQGSKFLTHARALLAHARDVQLASASANELTKTEVQFGCFHTLAPLYVPKLVRGFSKQNPGVKFCIDEGAQDHLIEGLRTGRLELALVYDVELPADIESKPIARLRPYVLLPANHRLARNAAVSLTELADEPFISLSIEPSRSYFARVLASCGVAPKTAHATTSIELLRGMVGNGLGYSLLTTRPAGDRTYDGAKLAVRSIAEEIEHGVVALATLKQMRPSSAAAAFAAFVSAQISK